MDDTKKTNLRIRGELQRLAKGQATRRAALLRVLADCKKMGEGPDRDVEQAHLFADGALLAYIADDEIGMAYHEIEKWHS